MTDEDDADAADDGEVKFYECEECGEVYLTKRQLTAHSHKHK